MSEQEPQELQQQTAQQQRVINELCYMLRFVYDSMPTEGSGIYRQTGVGYAMTSQSCERMLALRQRLGNTVARYWPEAELRRDEPIGTQEPFDTDGISPA